LIQYSPEIDLTKEKFKDDNFNRFIGKEPKIPTPPESPEVSVVEIPVQEPEEEIKDDWEEWPYPDKRRGLHVIVHSINKYITG
jgi:hypothetical protein